MFCSKCKSLMYSDGKEWKCSRCKHTQPIDKESRDMLSLTKKRVREPIVIDENMIGFNRIDVECPKCGNDEAYWILKQMRGADEPETTMYRCTRCNYTWRTQ